MSQQIIAYFANFIQRELGIIYSDHNWFQLENRLEEIVKHLELGGIQEFYQLAQKGMPEAHRQLLLDIATNNETSFFRDPKIFSAIEKTVIPTILKSLNATDKINIWSAAGSTGQEALSVAMQLEEFAHSKKISFQFEILMTDISERVLKKAQSASYTQLESDRGLPISLRQKYFSQAQDKWEASNQLRNHISFKKYNLMDPIPFPQKFHLVLCRNVLIYQNIPGKVEILKRIAQKLHSGGFLILGSGENLLGLSDEFQQDLSNGVVLYQKKSNGILAA